LLLILIILSANAQESLKYGISLRYTVLGETDSLPIKGVCVNTYGKYPFLDRRHNYGINVDLLAKAFAKMYAKSLARVVYKYSWF
jgi:hypothetical protein